MIRNIVSVIISVYRRTDCRLKDLAKIILFAAFLVFLIHEGADNLRYNWQWYRVRRYLYIFNETGFHPGPLLKGLFVTFQITSLSLLFTFIFGLIAAVFRLSESLTARLTARFYLEAVRNTPSSYSAVFYLFCCIPDF